jgi:MFS family permease
VDLPGAGPVTLGWRSVRAGSTVLWREPLRTPVLVAAVAIAVSGLTNAAVLLHLVGGLHHPATHLGILSSSQGAGSIAGGLLVGRLLARLAAARVAALGAVLFAAACVAWSLPWWPAMITGSVLAGLGLPWTLIAGITAIQTGTPEHLLGRVAATGTMVMFGPINLAIPLGSALAGLGARPPLLLGAGVVLTAALLAGLTGRSVTDSRRRPGGPAWRNPRSCPAGSEAEQDFVRHKRPAPPRP